MSEDAIKALTERVAKLEAIIAKLGAAFGAGGASSDAASDRELDHPTWGDPKAVLSPRDWNGPPMKGKKFSECDPDFLELLAESYDYFERKNRESGAKTPKGKPKADFDKQSARLCRGWSRRLRSGWKAPEKPASAMGNGSRFGGGTSAFGGPGVSNGRTPTNPYAGPFGTSRAMPPESRRDVELDVPEDDAIEPPLEEEKPVTETRLVDEEDDDPPLALAGGAR